jgi:hypothetical protein
VLERVNADPDDDLAMLSRQFLRAIEGYEALREAHNALMEDIADKMEARSGDQDRKQTGE